jgi:hypothetical protein
MVARRRVVRRPVRRRGAAPINTVKKIGKIPDKYSVKFIENYISKKCTHQTWHSGADICTPVGNMLVLGLKEGADISKTLINKYLGYITSRGYYSCMKQNAANLVGIIDEIFKHVPFVPSNAVLKKFIMNDQYYQCITTLANENNNFTMFDETFVKYCLETVCVNYIELKDDADTDHAAEYHYEDDSEDGSEKDSEKDSKEDLEDELDGLSEDEEPSYKHDSTNKICPHEDLINTLLDNCDITKVVDTMFKCRCLSVQKRCLRLMDEQSELITKDHMYQACELLPVNKDVVDKFHNMGFEVDHKCLEIVCKHCDVDSIHQILCYKIDVNRQSFQNIMSSKEFKVKLSRYGPRRGLTFDPGMVKRGYSVKGYSDEKLELLIKFGYKPDREDLEESIRAKVLLPEADRFGLYLDDDLMEICYEKNFYPNYEFKGDENLMELRKICKTKGLNVVKKYVEKHQTKPDRVCLRNACMSSYQESTDILLYLIKQHQLDFNFSDLELFITSKNKFGDRYRYRSIPESYKKTLRYLVRLLHKKYEPDDYESDEEENEDENEEDNEVQVSKEEVKNMKIDMSSEEEADGSTNKSETLKVLRLRTKGVPVPKQKNRKLLVPKKYCEYFDTDKKTKKSYTEIQEEMINLIKQNGWVSKQDEQMIDLPGELRKTLKLGEGYVHMKNVDKLVNQFYCKN